VALKTHVDIGIVVKSDFWTSEVQSNCNDIGVKVIVETNSIIYDIKEIYADAIIKGFKSDLVVKNDLCNRLSS